MRMKCAVFNHKLVDGVLVTNPEHINFIKKSIRDFRYQSEICRSCRNSMEFMYKRKMRHAKAKLRLSQESLSLSYVSNASDQNSPTVSSHTVTKTPLQKHEKGPSARHSQLSGNGSILQESRREMVVDTQTLASNTMSKIVSSIPAFRTISEATSISPLNTSQQSYALVPGSSTMFKSTLNTSTNNHVLRDTSATSNVRSHQEASTSEVAVTKSCVRKTSATSGAAVCKPTTDSINPTNEPSNLQESLSLNYVSNASDQNSPTVSSHTVTKTPLQKHEKGPSARHSQLSGNGSILQESRREMVVDTQTLASNTMSKIVSSIPAFRTISEATSISPLNTSQQSYALVPGSSTMFKSTLNTSTNNHVLRDTSATSNVRSHQEASTSEVAVIKSCVRKTSATSGAAVCKPTTDSINPTNEPSNLQESPSLNYVSNASDQNSPTVPSHTVTKTPLQKLNKCHSARHNQLSGNRSILQESRREMVVDTPNRVFLRPSLASNTMSKIVSSIAAFRMISEATSISPFNTSQQSYALVPGSSTMLKSTLNTPTNDHVLGDTSATSNVRSHQEASTSEVAVTKSCVRKTSATSGAAVGKLTTDSINPTNKPSNSVAAVSGQKRSFEEYSTINNSGDVSDDDEPRYSLSYFAGTRLPDVQPYVKRRPRVQSPDVMTRYVAHITGG